MMLFLCVTVVVILMVLLVLLGCIYDLQDTVKDLQKDVQGPSRLHATTVLNGEIIYDE